jgi:putative transposase
LAEGEIDGLLTPHAVTLAPGNDAAGRQAGYRALFREGLDPGVVEELGAATNGGWSFGSERFKREIAEAAGRRAEKLPAWRKPKARNDAEQGILL